MPCERNRTHGATPARHLAGLLTVLVAGCVGIGCGGAASRPDAVPVFPVEGRLFVDGKPAVGARVSFHPEGTGPTITASVLEDGRFVPSQSDGAIGLAEGVYSLTATWPQGETDRFAGEHADPAKPLARLTVQGGVNLMPPIQLSGAPGRE